MTEPTPYAENDRCRCGRIAVGMKVTEQRNLNPDCPIHGTRSADYVAKLEGALRYIASPTLGRPSDVDVAEFVRQGGGSEHAIRTALAYCITLAQQALESDGEAS